MSSPRLMPPPGEPALVRALGSPRRLARIIEADCIGCTLCIRACPVDAIVGSAKHMHAVVTQWCTGCELCAPPCPVDCIVFEAAPAGVVWGVEVADEASRRERARAERLGLGKAVPGRFDGPGARVDAAPGGSGSNAGPAGADIHGVPSVDGAISPSVTDPRMAVIRGAVDRARARAQARADARADAGKPRSANRVE